MSDMKPISIGVIGCGNISDTYFAGAARSCLVRVKACADLNHGAAQAKALQYGIAAVSVDQLLADPEISIAINLTVPRAHAPVALQILDAGKHVYLEKPLAATLTEARAVLAHAEAKGLRVGCAPDTFFGAAHQACRRAVDSGAIGKPIGGSVAVLSHGMESWHPKPAFFYRIVGLLDMAAAIQQGRAHRANGALALHVLEVLEAFERSSIAGCHIAIESRCQRPEPLPLGAGEAVFGAIG
jgi:predicted dehydrogenase